ncbi:hypothetical protein GGI43DRAFT_402699 [Trichoderma evansii]
MVAFTKLILLASTVAASIFPLPPPVLGNNNDSLIITDIKKNILPQLDTLSKDIFDFPGSGAAGAEKINHDVNTLIQTFKVATVNVEAGGFDVLQIPTLLAQLEPLVPKLTAMLIKIGKNAPAWNKFEKPELARQELEEGKTVLLNYLDALIKAVPGLQTTADPVKDVLKKAFDEAIQFYA